MKVKFDIEIDTETGQWSFKCHNLSNPGAAIDFSKSGYILKKACENIEVMASKAMYNN